MKCKNCGKNFIKSHHKQTHCSPHCRKKYARRAKYNRRCKMCGSKFISKSIRKQTCSVKCFHNLMSAESKSRYDQAVQVIEKVACVICGSEMEVDKFHTWRKFCSICSHKREKQADADRCKRLTDSWVKKHIWIKSKGRIRFEHITVEMINETRKSITEYRYRKIKRTGRHCKVYFPTCVICGSVFTANNKRSKACPGGCARAYDGRRRAEYAPRLDKCLECGEPIERNSHKYPRFFCGARCCRRFQSQGKAKGFDITKIAVDHPEIAEEYRALRQTRRVINNIYQGRRTDV